MFDRDMRYLVVSRRWRSDFKLGDQLLTGRSHYEVFPEISERWKTIHQRCLQGAVERCEEDPFLREDGTTDWIQWEIRPWHDDHGSIGGIIIFTEVITQRKQVETALRDERRLVDALLENLPDFIYFKDTASRFLRINPALAQCFGVTAAAAVGKTDADFVPAAAARKAVADDQAVIRTGLPLVEVEEQIVQPDGRIRWELTTKLPLRDDTGRIIGICGISSDITKRKQTEEQIRVANQELNAALAEVRRRQDQIIQQEQLRGLGQMASGIAHDFNNALSPIVGFTELLLNDPTKRTDQPLLEKWLRSIYTCATDATAVVKRIREFGRQKKTNNEIFQPVDLNRLVAQTIELTAPHWKDQTQATGSTIQVDTELQPVPAILGDESAIRGILTNLIFNAADAMPTGGRLTLGTAVEDRFVRLSIRDTGTGMTEEVRHRCFEPFYTTKGQQGTGLGLSMTHSVVQRHGGTVAVQTALGRGTTFTVRFPIPRQAIPPTVPAPAAPLPNSLHILVVDDDPGLCEVIQAELNSDGHLVETAANGTAALTRLMGSHFDLVLTDLAMPQMNGKQLAAAIHQSIPSLPVILMTGFGDQMNAAGEMPPHISTILCKPVTIASLRAALAKIFKT